ncbi:MAG: hypothetical protein LBE34_06710 [Flavobacteriaceae bacterium]|jgi:hypothetical protein|nr:hypothetical protein [Flavobacteriaceae bacterium]
MNAYYSFLPYIRSGLNTYLTTIDNPNGASPNYRSNLKLKIDLLGERVQGGSENSVIEKDFALKGPGDVVGINKNEIVKINPENWVTNFEPNYLPFIEFYDEDFCWRYTPTKYRKDGGNDQYQYRLRPWITLVVLMDDEFETFQAQDGKSAFRLKRSPKSVFPKQDTLWACAHVHVNDNLSQNEQAIGNNNQSIEQAVNKLGDIVLKQTPENVISRLMSTRRLLPNTGYTAFVIPTYETGRRVGLGLSPFSGNEVQMQQGAWSDQTPSGIEFPIYHQWYFKTGNAGDFESLVRLLQPRILSNTVGKRKIDLQKSNNPQLENVAPPIPVINMGGIAQPLDFVDENWDLKDSNLYVKELRDILNKPTNLLNQVGGADPIIAPPIYGKWHAVRDIVTEVNTNTPDWLQEVNLDPRFRIFAGAGVETIRRNQEEYMNIAWEQIGEVLEANRKLQQLQVSRFANLALYDKHFVSLKDPQLLNISAPAHQRMLNLDQGQTLFKDVDSSRIPVSMLSGTFRRLTRANSTLTKGALYSNEVKIENLLERVNIGAIEIAKPYESPEGQVNYDVWHQDQLSYDFTMSLPQNSGFRFSNPGVVMSNPSPGHIGPQVNDMVKSIADLHHVIEGMADYEFVVNPELPMQTMRNAVLEGIEPFSNALSIANNFIKLNNVQGGIVRLLNVNQILASPRIKIPMYEELSKISPDWIMPGLNDIEMNSINILKVNQKYLEAYMLGLNYEMGRELMWRGYPTDQRGTCFSFFWGYNNSIENLEVTNEQQQIYNLDEYRDIEDIHKWRANINLFNSPLKQLGTNNARAVGPSMLVLTIRGELLRKYPGTVIYLQQAQYIDDKQPRRPIQNTEIYPVFTGKIDPDIYLVGFPIDANQIKGTGFGQDKLPGYFVVFQERANQIRFGADEESNNISGVIKSWDDLSWSNLKENPEQDGFIDFTRKIVIQDNSKNNPDQITWNWNSATVAYALHQAPVKLNVHADGLIPS